MARAPYFTEAECVIIMQGYEEFKSTIQGKSNTSAANKSRQACWQRIADRVNASSNTAQRTWQQVRMKYKNIMTSANKKKLSIKATGGGPPPEAFSRAEELAVANNVGRPTMEGVEGGVQSDPGASDMCTLYVQGNIAITLHKLSRCTIMKFKFMCYVQWRGVICKCSSHLQSQAPPVILRYRRTWVRTLCRHCLTRTSRRRFSNPLPLLWLPPLGPPTRKVHFCFVFDSSGS
ncbi:uncharacterized protein [Paramormyrops kingsleyae]|uniref:uncharacterized protein isoform X1 n=1 Tax=Paramormyrops kingsleyae TaxID=1676925 RepID=UPI003B972034